MQKTWYSHTLEYGDQLIRKHPVHWNPTRPCVLGPPARPAALPSLLPGFPSRLDLQTLKRPGRGACCPPSVPWHPGIRSVCAPTPRFTSPARVRLRDSRRVSAPASLIGFPTGISGLTYMQEPLIHPLPEWGLLISVNGNSAPP